MRVLDLGSHDGFVTNWIGRQFPEGHELVLDGVEANPQAVDVANRRHQESSLAGVYKVGLAEDAPNLFMPKSYDAVVAFELIEHVPDVDEFLSVCESMLVPGGRIYLSTPNGTFGAGYNPHHLRVYRAVDMFELCRRRGEVVDLLMGYDGVTVIAYTPTFTLPPFDGEVPRVFPAVKPTATVHTGGGWEAWDPDDIETRGLGGSETAAVHLADSLSRLGYVVTVFGEFREPVMRKQVVYRHHSMFDPQEYADLAVISRQPHLFARPLNATRKVLWMHDTDYGDALTEGLADRMDAIMVLSEWHRGHVVARYPFLADSNKVVVTRNGIDPERFPLDQIPCTKERPNRAIYSSSPDRGLDLLLRLWPRVRERVEDAELVYCYSAVYDAVAATNSKLREFRDELDRLGEQEGVTNLGPLNQFALAGAMAKCRVWLAPSWCTPFMAWTGEQNGFKDWAGGVPFNETFCIGALESAAAGCRRIVSPWGALAERAAEDAKRTYVIDPPQSLDGSWPNPPIDEDAWVDAIARALEAKSNVGPSKHALSQTWDQVAVDLAG